MKFASNNQLTNFYSLFHVVVRMIMTKTFNGIILLLLVNTFSKTEKYELLHPSFLEPVSQLRLLFTIFVFQILKITYFVLVG